MQWYDKRILSILSTFHDNTAKVERCSRHAVGGREIVEKPEAITEYNKYMGGQTGEISCSRTTGFPTVQSSGGRELFFSFMTLAL